MYICKYVFMCLTLVYKYLLMIFSLLVFSQIKEMNNYLTVPAAPPDSPTMCRARLASGKHIRLHLCQMPALSVRHRFLLSGTTWMERSDGSPKASAADRNADRKTLPFCFPDWQKHVCWCVPACKPVCGFILGRNTDFKPALQQKESRTCKGTSWVK